MSQQQELTPIKRVMRALDDVRERWDGLCTNPALKFDAEREWVLQACEKNDYATGVAAGNLDAVQAVLANVAAVGVTLDPARKLAYVLPRDKKMVYDLSYMGLIDIAIRAKSILWAQAAVVHEKDTFKLRGYDEAPLHERDPFAKDRGPVVGVYVVVKTPTGDYLTNTMTAEELDGIRDRSPSWKKDKSGPWKTDWAEMAKKSVVKNGWKYWPRSETAEGNEAIARAVHYLNTDGGQGIDLTPADDVRTLQQIWLERVKNADTVDELRALLPDARKEFEKVGDADGYKVVRQAAIARDAELGGGKPKAATVAGSPSAQPPADQTRQMTEAEKEVARITALIQGAQTNEELEATGPRIDALQDPAAVDALNKLYNVAHRRINPAEYEGK